MKFTKVHWFYEVEVNGLVVGVQKKDNGKWEAWGGKGLLATGRTRKEAVEKYITINEGRL